MVSRSWKFPYGSGDLSDDPRAESVKSEFRFCLREIPSRQSARQAKRVGKGREGEKRPGRGYCINLLRLTGQIIGQARRGRGVAEAWPIKVMAFELPLRCGLIKRQNCQAGAVPDAPRARPHTHTRTHSFRTYL